MGYNIEISFNILKHSNVTELQNTVKLWADECGCQNIYEDYEYETNVQFKRNHCIMTVNFSKSDIYYLLKFLKFIRNENGLFLEMIYDEDTQLLLYASQYYVTQKMNKAISKDFKISKRERSYSDDENMILSIIKRQKV
jgi:hypothetical protein